MAEDIDSILEKEAELLKAIDSRIERGKILAEYDEQTLRELLKKVKGEKKLEEAINSRLASMELMRKSAERQAKLAEEQLEKYKGTTKELELQNNLAQAKLSIVEAELETLKIGSEEYNKKLKERNKLLEEQQIIQAKIDNSFEKISEHLENAAKEGAKLAGSIFDLDSPAKAVGANLKSMSGSLMQAGKSAFLSKFPQLAKFAGPLGAVASVVAQIVGSIIELTTRMVDTSNAIQKATGVNAQFADSITMGYKETREFGGTLKDLEAVAIDLSKTFTDFTMLNGQMAQSLATTGTLLGKLGVSSQDFAKGIQLSTKAFGMTVKEAEEAQLRLAALAQDIGVAPSQMAADFAAAGPQLAKFGSNAEATFKRLAVTAKSTGIEINRLLSITEKFDTFEGAATQAGKLNAALGGNFVNAMELLTETDPAARFDMMTDAIKDAGLSFDEMSYYQKKFYAESMGLSDVNELALALSGNTELLSQNLGKTSAEIEETAKRAQQMQSIQEQLNLLFADMVPIIEPVIAGMRDFVGFLLENKEAVQAFFIGLTFAAIALAISIAPVGIAVAALAAVLGGLGYLLFKQTWASSFLDGIGKIGNGFSSIAEMAGMASGDVKSLTGDMDGLGQSMFKGKSIKVGAEMTSTALEGMQESTMAAASTTKAAAPVLATSNAVSNAVSNASTTNNNYNGSTGETKVNINFANKRFKDFFDVEVENSIGRAARKAVI